MNNLGNIRLIRFLLLGMIVWGFQACNEDEVIDPNTENQDFVIEAASSNTLEVEAGTLAESRGSDESVRAYGAMIVEDHTAIGISLSALATSKEWAIPTEMRQKHQDMLARLDGLEGEEFDREFIDLMIESHEEAIELFEQAAEGDHAVPDMDLRAFAADKLPGLRTHLTLAETIRLAL